MDLRQLAPGLSRWTARHPDWTPEEGGPDGWQPEVGSLLYETGDAVVLVDPLVPAETEQGWGALDAAVERAGGPPDVLLTIYWHARSAQAVLDRYGARVWAHEQATDPIAERVRFTHTFAVGDPLPGDIQAFHARWRNEVLFWLPKEGALVAGDVLLGAEGGGLRVCPDSWLREGVDPADLRDSLRSLLDLPIEIVLVAHGEPVLENGQAALERALAA